MRLFGIKEKQTNAAVQTAVSSNNMNHPFNVLSQYMPLSNTEIRLYSTLREAVPIIDAAISKIVRLVGECKVKCEDKEIEHRVNKFLSNVQVNACGQGINQFLATHLNQLITYGTAISEIVINPNSENIHSLYNASLNDVELRIDDSPLKLMVCRKEDGKLQPIKYPELILVSALNPEPGNVYGNSIMKGLPFVSNILLKIYNTIGINWERVGNVRFAVTYKPSSDAGERAYSKERATQIAKEWSRTMKNGGPPSDFIAVGDVDIKVIGADNQILDSQIPVRQMLEQIVSKLSIPPFLLGLNWSTSERMSTQQADILTSELDGYRRILNPIVSRICSMWAKLNGYQCDFEIEWDNINLQDEVQIANAKLMYARAREIEKRLEEK